MIRLFLALFAGTGFTACLFTAQSAMSDSLIDRLLRPGFIVSHMIFSPTNYTLAVQASFVANAVFYSAITFLLVVFFDGPRAR